LGLTSRISVVVSGADLQRGKPDPLPYLETLRLLDLPPAGAFAVEDAFPGVVAAHAAGLAVIGIGRQSLEPAYSDYCLARFPDFAGFDQWLLPR
jgi:beta-phosphoglucomutase-like phosphatase (HAD superfamily)